MLILFICWSIPRNTVYLKQMWPRFEFSKVYILNSVFSVFPLAEKVREAAHDTEVRHIYPDERFFPLKNFACFLSSLPLKTQN